MVAPEPVATAAPVSHTSASPVCATQGVQTWGVRCHEPYGDPGTGGHRGACLSHVRLPGLRHPVRQRRLLPPVALDAVLAASWAHPHFPGA